MGDTRIVDGVLEHETSKGRWERIVLDDCGKPLSVCLHGEEPKATVDEGGRLIMELGGTAVSMEPAMAAKWADELGRIVAPATEANLSTAYEARVENYRQRAADERTAIEEETARRREELTVLGERVEELRAEGVRLDAEVEAKRGQAGQP